MQSAAAGDTLLLNALTALQAANTQAVDAFFATYDDPRTPDLRPLFNAYVAATDPDRGPDHPAERPAPGPGRPAQAGTGPGVRRPRRPAATRASPPRSWTSPPSCPRSTPPAPAAAAVADLTAVGQGGLSVQFFLTNNPSATPDLTVPAAPSLTYGPGNPLPAPAGTATAIAAQLERLPQRHPGRRLQPSLHRRHRRHRQPHRQWPARHDERDRDRDHHRVGQPERDLAPGREL